MAVTLAAVGGLAVAALALAAHSQGGYQGGYGVLHESPPPGGLKISATADTSFTRTFAWDLEKSATPDTWDLFTGDTGTSTYTVKLTKTLAGDSGWAVSGEVTIKNKAAVAATITSVTTALSGGINATVSCGVTFPYTLAAGGTLMCSYTASLPDGAARTSTTTVATTGAVAGGTATADVQFDQPTTVVNGKVKVEDTLGVSWWAYGSGSKTFEETFECDEDEGTHTNTASIVGTSISDSATVTVTCHALEVTKTVDPSLEKRWTWTIDKSASPTSVTLAPGATATIAYTVALTAQSSLGGHAATGEIRVKNPSPVAAIVKRVKDIVSPSIEADVDCGVSFPYTLAPGATLVCTYEVELPDGADRTNTAYVKLVNHDFGGDGCKGDDDEGDDDGHGDDGCDDGDSCVGGGDDDDEDDSHALGAYGVSGGGDDNDDDDGCEGDDDSGGDDECRGGDDDDGDDDRWSALGSSGGGSGSGDDDDDECEGDDDGDDGSKGDDGDDGSHGGSASGWTVFSGSAAVDFDGADVTEIDECVQVTDSRKGVLGTVCAGDADKTLEYTLTVGTQGTNANVIVGPGQSTVSNTATFLTNDTKKTGSDTAVVTVTVTTTTVVVQPQPAIDVSVDKSATARADLNGVVTYTLTVRNNGPSAATNVQVADPAPGGIQYQTATSSLGTCSVTAALVTCNIGTLAASQSATVTITAKATAVGTLTNTVTVVGQGGPDTNTANNSDSAQTVVPQALLPPTKPGQKPGTKKKPKPAVKVKPAASVCMLLTVTPKSITVDSRPERVRVLVTAARQRMRGVRVVLRGPGVSKSQRTARNGVAVLTINPRQPGIIRVTAVERNRKVCGARRIGVVAAFVAPLTG